MFTEFYRDLIIARCLTNGYPLHHITILFNCSEEQVVEVIQNRADLLHLSESVYFHSAFNMLPGTGPLPFTENVLFLWYNAHAHTGYAIFEAFNGLQYQAVRLHQLLRERPIEFVANKAWFDAFRVRFGIQNPYVEYMVQCREWLKHNPGLEMPSVERKRGKPMAQAKKVNKRTRKQERAITCVCTNAVHNSLAYQVPVAFSTVANINVMFS